MSKARDIANILSANTAIATDAEVTAALSTAVTNERTASATLTNKNIDGNLNVINVKRGTTAERPMTSTLGDQYYDTTLNSLFNYTNTGWTKVSQDPAPLISQISPSVSPVAGTLITITGSDFRVGASVQFIGTDAVVRNSPVVTFVAANSITATTPNLPVAYEPYDVKVINSDNQFSQLDNALDAGGTPTWTTPSGSLGSFSESASISLSVSASDPDGTSIVYSSSNLPVWLSLNSSTGLLTGTAPVPASETTYSFDITASDGLNTSSRSFSLVVTPVLLSGGTLVTSGGYNYHIFNSTTPSSFTVSNGSKNVECLLVAGGGGTAGNRGGGGGAGGLRVVSQSLPSGTYKTFIGQKGNKAITDSLKLQGPGGFSAIANSSSGYRYYRIYAAAGENFTTATHYPRVSRIGVMTEDGDTNVVVFTSDNTSDSGTIPAGNNYNYDFGSKKIVYGFYIYSTYGGGNRAGITTIYGSDDNSNWTEIDSIITDNGTSTGLIRFYIKNSYSNMVLSNVGGGSGAIYNSTFSDVNGGSGGGGEPAASPGTGVSGQGNSGGSATGTGGGGSGAGGGGGGYSTAGSNGSNSVNGGAGGQGWTIPSGWSSLSIFSGMTVLSSGGGGAAPFGTPGAGGTGAGNGGSGTSSSSTGNGGNATSYGSGGGGGAYGGGYSGGTGGDGYQGIIVMRYPV